ncbi:unnamed protein product [Cylicocyclus nassatus]|uniref:SXP/RAL-2 family protein Ani s 5-like cation-binding domain-containing protein n=1 Tax=Cylicocyclus nassatus TaxID=53992 RepID=A0AA36GJK8_CYLNA|nr:unnamed protein product [Cylicocyclus nassatus]
MNTILVFVALLGFVLCEEPSPQPPQALPEVKKPEAVPVKGIDNLSEEEKAKLEKRREQVKKEVREKMSKLIEQLNGALDKQSAILDNKALSRKEKLEALRKLKEENPKVYKVLKVIFKQVVPKHKRGKRNGHKRKMGSLGFRRDRKLNRGWQKGKKERKFFKKKSFGPKNLPEPMKPAKLDAVSVKA